MPFFESDHSTVEIDLGALRNNLKRLLAMTAPENCRLMPVVKSDAYGHGLIQVAMEVLKEDVWGLGIYEIEEASLLRREGVDAPIFLLSGLLGGNARRALDLDLTMGIVCEKELYQVNEAARAIGTQAHVHLKVDTGMGRFGFLPREFLNVVSRRKDWPNVIFEGIYSHFSSADDPEDLENSRQLAIFRYVLESAARLGFHPVYVHMANSAAIFNMRDALFNLARPGIALYGAYGHGGSIPKGFEPVMRFTSVVVGLRTLQKGSLVSYGHTYRLYRDSRLALVPVGYDNGLTRRLSNRAVVLIKGYRCPVIGNVCMKTLVVDVTGVPNVSEGDEVVIVGKSGREQVNMVELAEGAGTISYELLCLIGKLNRRRFKR